MISNASSRRPRAGFTLIELLVVIAIIVVLIALTTSAVMSFRLTGPRLATRSNLASMKTALDTQWKAVAEKAQRENMDPSFVPFLGGLLPSDPRARAAYVQLKLKQAFPVSFDEIANPTANGLPKAYSAYTTYLSQTALSQGTTGVTSANAKTITSIEVQQAICLMMILERGPGNSGNITPESLGSSGAKELVLRDGTLIRGCVDAYDPRDESGVPPPPSPLPPKWVVPRQQPAGPLLFTRAVNGADQTPGILSAGGDMQYGVDLTTFAPSPAGNRFVLDNIRVP